MPAEQVQYIAELDKEAPANTDLVSEGADHLRLIKRVLQNSFKPNIDEPLIPDIVDKPKHLLAVNETADGIEWRNPQDLPMGANYFRYWKSTDQVISGTNPERIQFDVEKDDIDSSWNASVWDIGVAGIYHIDAWWRIGLDAILDHDIVIRKYSGGTWENYKQLAYADYTSGINKRHSLQISADIVCNSGDKLDIAAWSESTMVVSGGGVDGNSMAGVCGYRIR